MQDFAIEPFAFDPIPESQECGNANGLSSSDPEGQIEDANTERFGNTLCPLDFLDGYENRFAYSLAFGVTTTYCLTMIFDDSQWILGQRIAAVIDSSPPYVSVFFRIIATVVIATGAYPLFVSIGSRYKRLGAVFGLAYTVTWFSLLCYKTTRIFRACDVTAQVSVASGDMFDYNKSTFYSVTSEYETSTSNRRFMLSVGQQVTLLMALIVSAVWCIS